MLYNMTVLEIERAKLIVFEYRNRVLVFTNLTMKNKTKKTSNAAGVFKCYVI